MNINTESGGAHVMGLISPGGVHSRQDQIAALVARTRLGVNQRDLELRLERLATGLRINRGADDPAGLIISERLRKEIRGIEQAINNSQRVINVISTAEGALNEVSAVERM